MINLKHRNGNIENQVTYVVHLHIYISKEFCVFVYFVKFINNINKEHL